MLDWLRKRRKPIVSEKRVARELDPRPNGCDCGAAQASDLTPDSNGHSWDCPCGLRY